MGAIEPLLGIVAMKNATGLVLARGEVPSLLPAGARAALTMPALSALMWDHLVNELLPPEQRATLASQGTLDWVYQSPTHGPYAVRATAAGETLRLILTRGATTPTIAAAPPPSAVATAPPPPAALDEPAVSAAIVPPATAPPREGTARIDRILDLAVTRGASDVLFSSDARPWLRVDGDLVECTDVPPTSSRELEAAFVARLDPASQRQHATTGSVDFAFDHPRSSGMPMRFRANLFRHGGGTGIALRPIRGEIPTLSELHLPASLTRLVDVRHGLLVFTGATGSGKSTTLASLLDHINRTRAAHIVTLEDPIEYTYVRRRSVVHQREVGTHVESFASGLRAALRENPDVLLVGEMRDAETMRLALTAAQTGHLVLTTLHSGNAVMAIDRIVDGFPEGEKAHVRHELAATLRHVIAQQLLPAVEGGRLPALEVLAVTHAVAAQIRDGRTHQIATYLETGAEDGMVPMTRALATRVRSGEVSREAALAVCEDRAMLERLLDDRAGSRPMRNPSG